MLLEGSTFKSEPGPLFTTAVYESVEAVAAAFKGETLMIALIDVLATVLIAVTATSVAELVSAAVVMIEVADVATGSSVGAAVTVIVSVCAVELRAPLTPIVVGVNLTTYVPTTEGAVIESLPM
jgi:hypothetical protein